MATTIQTLKQSATVKAFKNTTFEVEELILVNNNVVNR